MSLDTTTLTTTNIPNIAARNVESRIQAYLAGLKTITDAFFAASGIEADFYADGTGELLDLSADAIALLTPIVGNSWAHFEVSYWTDEEDRLNSNIESVYADMPDPVIAVGHP